MKTRNEGRPKRGSATLAGKGANNADLEEIVRKSKVIRSLEMSISTVSEPNEQIVVGKFKNNQLVVFHVKLGQDYFYHPGRDCQASFDHAVTSIKSADLVFVNAALWSEERTGQCLDNIRLAGHRPCSCQLKKAALLRSQPYYID